MARNSVEVLHYESLGEGPPLLLIHGLGSSVIDWEPQIAHFSKRYRVIAIDLRGHGKSKAQAGPFTVPTFAADIASVLRSLNVSHAHVVGISLGGAIAFQLALDHPELVRTLTIVNSGPYVLDNLLVKAALAWRFTVLRLFGIRRLGEMVARRLFPGAALDAVRAKFVERFSHNDPAVYRETLSSLVGWSVKDRLGELRVPTLILASDHDYTPVRVKQAYLPLVPGATLEVIPNAHHGAPMEVPDVFNALLEKFLSRQASTAS